MLIFLLKNPSTGCNFTVREFCELCKEYFDRFLFLLAEKFWLWKNRYPECLYGILQTPIHIETFRAETVLMPALNFIDYENFLAPPITLQNNGHTGKQTYLFS